MKNWQHSIISGGGSGLGLGIAQRLLRRGGKVSILDLTVGEQAREQLDHAAAQGNSAWQFAEADLTDEARVTAAVNEIVQAYGAPDLALNSAGILVNKTFAAMPSSDFRKVMDVNVHGSYNFAAAVLPHLRPGSRLALIASIAGLTSSYGYTAYGASKFAVVGLATTLRYEYEPLGIGISCVCPPEVKTPMVATERSPGNADPISLILKDIAGSLEPDFACDAILAGLDAGRWQIIPGFKGKLTATVARHWPAGFFAFMRFNIKRGMKKHGVAHNSAQNASSQAVR